MDPGDNPNLIDRDIAVATSADTDETLYARSTYSWGQYCLFGLISCDVTC